MHPYDGHDRYYPTWFQVCMSLALLGLATLCFIPDQPPAVSQDKKRGLMPEIVRHYQTDTGAEIRVDVPWSQLLPLLTHWPAHVLVHVGDRTYRVTVDGPRLEEIRELLEKYDAEAQDR